MIFSLEDQINLAGCTFLNSNFHDFEDEHDNEAGSHDAYGYFVPLKEFDPRGKVVENAYLSQRDGLVVIVLDFGDYQFCFYDNDVLEFA